jgi:Domain of unknown function (DUF4190)
VPVWGIGFDFLAVGVDASNICGILRGVTVETQPAPLRPHVDGLAIVAFILGVLSFGPLPFIGAGLAIWLGSTSRRRIDSDPGLGGRGLATTAIILGIANLVLWALILIFLVGINTGQSPIHVGNVVRWR